MLVMVMLDICVAYLILIDVSTVKKKDKSTYQSYQGLKTCLEPHSFLVGCYSGGGLHVLYLNISTVFKYIKTHTKSNVSQAPSIVIRWDGGGGHCCCYGCCLTACMKVMVVVVVMVKVCEVAVTVTCGN